VDRTQAEEAAHWDAMQLTDLPDAPQQCKVYTPKPVAAAMVKRLGDRPALSWLEPSFGSGVFLEVLNVAGVSKERITAIDLDRQKQPADRFAQICRGSDFIRWSCQARERFDRIVGNPPYVGLNRLPPPLLESALSVRDPFGKDLSLGSNYWYAFLCASLHVLNPGGSFAFVLPAAWEFADYADGLRDNIHRLFRRVEVHRSTRPIFSSVQEGSIVLVGEAFLQSPGVLRKRQHAGPEALALHLKRAVRLNSIVDEIKPRSSTRTTCLGNIVQIRIGGVTGNADYFLLTEAKRKSKHLPLGSVRPVLSKARHLVSARISKDVWRNLRDKGERIWLFYPPERSKSMPSVRRYLELRPDRGGCRKKLLKVRTRPLWYKTLLPAKCDGFISGMSTSGPWISFSAMPQLTATNTLYVITFRKRLSREAKSAWALSLLTSTARQAIRLKQRRYAQGLSKLEPGDLAELYIPKPRTTKGATKVYNEAIRNVLSGNLKAAEAIADRFLGNNAFRAHR
jgi:adenine-specific DNA-methyltransferase